MNLKLIIFLIIYKISINDGCNSQVNQQFCGYLNNVELPRAVAEIDKQEANLNAQMAAGISLTPDQPGSSFFKHDDIPEEEHKLFKTADVSMILSDSVSKFYYPNGVPQFTDIRNLLNSHTSCLKDFFNEHCEGNSKISCTGINRTYRPIDGICATLTDPKLGSGDTHYGSMVKPHFDDGVQSFRRSIGSRKELPLARLLTTTFFHNCKNTVIKPINANVGGIMFGQLFTHDISYKEVPRAKAAGFGIQCCTPDGKSALPAKDINPNCAPMLIPKNDPSLPQRGCNHFLRTQAVNDNNCVLTTRTHLNEQTSYADLSIVYSQHKDANLELRTLTDGLMKLDENGIFLKNANGEFILPDDRAHQTPPLAVLHIVWTRLHNIYAKAFKTQKPNWDDERLFQETRRFVIAVYQHIVVNEWIQIFVGNATYRLRAPAVKDAKTTNEFAQATLRFGHHYTPEIFKSYNDAGIMVESKNLSDIIFNLEGLERSYDNILRGLIYQPAENNGCRDQMVNRVFKNPDGIGLDLISMDIHRGRDHGVAPYHVFLELCHGIKVKTFDDLKTQHSAENIDKLRTLYSSALDIDLYVGGALEIEKLKTFGPTFTCITNEQMNRLRIGDDYFFDNPANPNPFTTAQLAEIKKVTWSSILCQTSRTTKAPKKGFLKIDATNPLVRCSTFTKPKFVL